MLDSFSIRVGPLGTCRGLPGTLDTAFDSRHIDHRIDETSRHHSIGSSPLTWRTGLVVEGAWMRKVGYVPS
eukprot:405630-Pyramimonas_sp.AAC.1